MNTQKYFWGLAIGAVVLAGIGVIFLNAPSPKQDTTEPALRETTTVVVSSAVESSPTPIMMAAVEPTNVPADSSEIPVADTAPPESDATPTLSSEDEEKLKEVATYRNKEFGFEFQYPKYRQLPPDGRLVENDMQRISSGLDSIPFELRSYGLGIAFHVEKKPLNFLELRSYIKEEHRITDQEDQELGVDRVTSRIFREIQIASSQALLEEYVIRGIPESVIYIEKKDYIYRIYFSGHLSGKPAKKIQRIRNLIDSWAFYRENE